MRTELYKERHCERVPIAIGTTEAILASGVANGIVCSISGLLRATVTSFASARNDGNQMIIDN
jgi:hypothetical protein